MKPQSTDKITADTNIEVDRIIYRDSFDYIVDPFDSTIYSTGENTIDFLLTSSFFSIMPYSARLDSGGNRIYKGTFYMPLIPVRQIAFYNYVDGSVVKLEGTVYDTVVPSDGYKLFIVVKSVNAKQQ